MSLQAIRWVFEKPVIDAMAAMAPAVPLVVDNSAIVDQDDTAEYALLHIDFGRVTEDALQIPLERIRGTIIFEAYTPKNIGPGRCQDITTAALRALNNVGHCGCIEACGAYGRTLNMIGPNFQPLDTKPYFFGRLACSFDSQYRDPNDCA